MTTLLGVNQTNAMAVSLPLSQQFKYNDLQTDLSSHSQASQKIFWIQQDLEDEELEDDLEDVDYLLF